MSVNFFLIITVTWANLVNKNLNPIQFRDLIQYNSHVTALNMPYSPSEMQLLSRVLYETHCIRSLDMDHIINVKINCNLSIELIRKFIARNCLPFQIDQRVSIMILRAMHDVECIPSKFDPTKSQDGLQCECRWYDYGALNVFRMMEIILRKSCSQSFFRRTILLQSIVVIYFPSIIGRG